MLLRLFFSSSQWIILNLVKDFPQFTGLQWEWGILGRGWWSITFLRLTREDVIYSHFATFQHIRGPTCGWALPKDADLSVSVLQVPASMFQTDNTRTEKEVPSEAMQSAQGHTGARQQSHEPRYSSCKSSRNTQAAQPLRSRTAGKLLLLRGKGRGGHKKMDLFISPYAGMHNSPLFSTWLFNFHAPLTLFLVWNFIYVSIDESAIYK